MGPNKQPEYLFASLYALLQTEANFGPFQVNQSHTFTVESDRLLVFSVYSWFLLSAQMRPCLLDICIATCPSGLLFNLCCPSFSFLTLSLELMITELKSIYCTIKSFLQLCSVWKTKKIDVAFICKRYNFDSTDLTKSTCHQKPI